MNVVVPAHLPGPGSPAYLALCTEGVPGAMESRLFSDTDYGLLFSREWDLREPFIVIEHDIIPAPGNVQALWDCPEPWCVYPYPIPGGGLIRGMGFAKYRPVGPAPPEWRETPWQMLDGVVVPHLNGLFGRAHSHEPAVAHARRPEA